MTRRNLRAAYVIVALSITAVISLILMMDLAYGAATPELKAGDVQSAAQRAASDEVAPSTDRSASVAKKRRYKHYKLPGWLAFDVTNETALYAYLYDIDATSYGAYGCSRYSPYGITCVGWISGTIYAPDYSYASDYVCDWYQDVWINKKNEVKTWTYQLECYITATY